MLEAAERHASREGVQLTLVEADITDFTVQVASAARSAYALSGSCVHWTVLQAEADLALLLFGTLKDLLTNTQLAACFRCCTRALAPGGMLVIEYEALHTATSGEWLAPDAWDFELDGKECVVEYGTEHDEFDTVTQVSDSAAAAAAARVQLLTGPAWPQVLQRNILVKEQQMASPAGRPKKGKAVPREVLLHKSAMRQRLYTLQEVQLVAAQCGLELAAMYGDTDESVPVHSPEAQRAVLFLRQRTPGPEPAAVG